MQRKLLLVLAAAGALLAACGSNSTTPTGAAKSSAYSPITYPAPASTAPAAPAKPAPTTAAPAVAIVAKSATSSLGTIVVDGAGHTLYGFTNDAMGTSTCNSGCAASLAARDREDAARGERTEQEPVLDDHAVRRRRAAEDGQVAALLLRR